MEKRKLQKEDLNPTHSVKRKRGSYFSAGQGWGEGGLREKKREQACPRNRKKRKNHQVQDLYLPGGEEGKGRYSIISEKEGGVKGKRR